MISFCKKLSLFELTGGFVKEQIETSIYVTQLRTCLVLELVHRWCLLKYLQADILVAAARGDDS